MADTMKRVKEAVYKRKGYILDNLSTLTMKQFRGMLEEDLSLPAKSLKDHRESIDRLVDKIVVEHTKQNEKVKDEEDEKEELGVLKDHNGSNSDEPKTDVKSSKAKTKKVKSSSANKENNKSGQKRSRKEQISDKAEKESKRPKISSKPASNANSKQSKLLANLKELCKKAGINIPTSIYKKKDEREIADAISALLEKHGLSKSSGRSEIAEVKARIQKEKELEGIDMSNIVEGGRRSRNRVNYVQASKGPALGLEDSEDEEDEQPSESASNSEDESGSEEAPQQPSNEKKRSLSKQKATSKETDMEEDDASDGTQEQESEENGSDEVSEDRNDNPQSPEDNSPTTEMEEMDIKDQKQSRPTSSQKRSQSKQTKEHEAPGKEASDNADSHENSAAPKPSRKMPDWSDDE